MRCMSRAVVLQHVPHEGPGRLIEVFRDYGLRMEVRHLYRGDEVPRTTEEIELLVVMGGPMGVADVGGERYPFLAQEVALLKARIDTDRPVLGICLGAQLLAYAAGAKVYPNMRRVDGTAVAAPELGWAPVRLPFPGGTDPVLAGVRDGAMMFHWHFDTFDLPVVTTPGSPATPTPAYATAVLLASTALCPNQAFRLRKRLLGFQFHFEMDAEGIEAMLSSARDDVVRVLGPGGEEQIRHDTQRYYDDYRVAGDRIIHNIVHFLRLN